MRDQPETQIPDLSTLRGWKTEVSEQELAWRGREEEGVNVKSQGTGMRGETSA